MGNDFNPDENRLVIGLGNPAKDYERTYHNIGHLFVDYLKNHQEKTLTPKLKTNCYMNESGRFVAEALKNRNLKPENLLLIHDDSDLKIGAYKFSFDRGAAGHKGVESVIKAIKTKKFWRLRIGVRKGAGLPAEVRPGRTKAGEFVLKTISAKDKKTFEVVFRKILSQLKGYVKP